MQETQETRVWFLGQEDCPEEEMATHSSILFFFFECWVWSQLFYPLSPSSTDSLVPLHFLPSEWYDLIWSCWYFSQQSYSASASFSTAFHRMYSAYKLNKQGDNIQPSRTPFPILNQSIVPSLVQTVASWPAYRFLRRQVRWSSTPISLRTFHGLLWSTKDQKKQ